MTKYAAENSKYPGGSSSQEDERQKLDSVKLDEEMLRLMFEFCKNFSLEDQLDVVLKFINFYKSETLPPTILFDGPAGAGKSTISKFLLEKLALPVFSNGMWYRASALALSHFFPAESVLLVQSNPEQKAALLEQLIVQLMTIEITFGENKVFFQKGQDAPPVEYDVQELSKSSVGTLATQLSDVPQITTLVERRMLEGIVQGSARVVDGRDTWETVTWERMQAVQNELQLEHLPEVMKVYLYAEHRANYRRILHEIVGNERLTAAWQVLLTENSENVERAVTKLSKRLLSMLSVSEKDLLTLRYNKLLERNDQEHSREQNRVLTFEEAKANKVYDLVLDTSDLKELEVVFIILLVALKFSPHAVLERMQEIHSQSTAENKSARVAASGLQPQQGTEIPGNHSAYF